MKHFDDFWAAYPRRVAKGAARKAWAKHKCDDHIDAILAKIPEYIADVQAKGWMSYAHPATWLNGERWEDDFSEPAKLSNAQGFIERRASRNKEISNESHTSRDGLRIVGGTFSGFHERSS